MKIETVLIGKDAFLTAYIPDPEYGYQVFRKRPGILLAPGGAYLIHATREKEGVALDFIARGFNVYILHYSIGFTDRPSKEANDGQLNTDNHYPKPVLEMLEAIHWLKAHAEEMNLQKDALFLMGFSAGGHLCASAGTMWKDPKLTGQLSFTPQGEELKAAGMVLAYPMIHPMSEGMFMVNDPKTMDAWLMKDFLFDTRTPSEKQVHAVDLRRHVNADTVPAFIWHSIDDRVVNPANTTEFVLQLQKYDIPCQYHLFDHGGHGMALAVEPYARNPAEEDREIALWRDLAEAWMKRRVKEQEAEQAL